MALLYAVLDAADRKDRGVGLQGLRYMPELKEWAHIISLISPRAYQALREVFQLPTLRSHQSVSSVHRDIDRLSIDFYRQNRAKQPGFPVGITPRVFEAISASLVKLGYNGPFHLSVDDTKLSPSLRPWYDHDRKAWVLLGTPGEPPLLPSPDQIANTMERTQHEKATQVSVLSYQSLYQSLPLNSCASGPDTSLARESRLSSLPPCPFRARSRRTS